MPHRAQMAPFKMNEYFWVTEHLPQCFWKMYFNGSWSIAAILFTLITFILWNSLLGFHQLYLSCFCKTFKLLNKKETGNKNEP